MAPSVAQRVLGEARRCQPSPMQPAQLSAKRCCPWPCSKALRGAPFLASPHGPLAKRSQIYPLVARAVISNAGEGAGIAGPTTRRIVFPTEHRLRERFEVGFCCITLSVPFVRPLRHWFLPAGLIQPDGPSSQRHALYITAARLIAQHLAPALSGPTEGRLWISRLRKARDIERLLI